LVTSKASAGLKLLFSPVVCRCLIQLIGMAAITIGLKERFSEEGFVPKYFGIICGSIPESYGSALAVVTDGASIIVSGSSVSFGT
jgi:hypothetical protein